MTPRQQDLARVLEFLESEARKRKIAHNKSGTWMAHVYYGLGIPSVIFATAAATTALSDYEVVAGACAGVAAVMTGVMTFLRNPDERASEQREIASNFDALEIRAHDLGLTVRDIPPHSLAQKTNQIQLELTNLSRRASGRPTRLTNDPQPAE